MHPAAGVAFEITESIRQGTIRTKLGQNMHRMVAPLLASEIPLLLFIIPPTYWYRGGLIGGSDERPTIFGGEDNVVVEIGERD